MDKTPKKQSSSKVVSAPLEKIVGEGRNYKYVKNCKELHLGGEGPNKKTYTIVASWVQFVCVCNIICQIIIIIYN